MSPEVTPETVRRAVQIYTREVWPLAAEAHIPALFSTPVATLADLLTGFRAEHVEGDALVSYSLRLGNDRYPFTKLVLQEFIAKGAFYFQVDTHDDMDMRPGFPDYDQWLELKRHNAGVKARVEAAWHREGIPTIATLVEQVARNSVPTPRTEERPARVVFVVEDQPGLSECLQALVREAGHDPVPFPGGEEALAALDLSTPDLILTDLEMGALSGLDLARRVRQREGPSRVPIVLVTAADLSRSDLSPVDAVVRKPYERGAMLRAIARHLGAGESAGEGSAT